MDAVHPTSVVIIDGRSGAGKSTLARGLASMWPGGPSVQLIGLDEMYPGWDGLESGAAYACARILLPRAEARAGTWQRWDWGADRYDGVETVDPDRPLILEGSGALTPAASTLADVRVWLEAPADERRRRALARDGETYRPHWERWARQEERHIVAHSPRESATHAFDLT